MNYTLNFIIGSIQIASGGDIWMFSVSGSLGDGISVSAYPTDTWVLTP
jgi:hypothetical protein